MTRFLLFFCLLLTIGACSDDDSVKPDGGTDQGEYNIYINGDLVRSFENGSETLWNPGPNGDIITLGPEVVGEGITADDPTAELMFLFFNTGSNGNQENILQVSLRTQEIAQGTPEEQNTRLFEYEGEMNPAGCTGVSGLVIEESGNKNIKGSFCFQLELFAGGSGGDETVTVHGDFTAVSIN